MAAMKIFLSWSGEQSHQLALALNDWLRKVLQGVEPFLSSKDIEAGERWRERLGKVLNDLDFGIVCLTKSNLTKPWIMFESGALAKKLEDARLIPVLCDVSEVELSRHPLTEFNYVHLDKEGMRNLIATISKHHKNGKLTKEELEETFELWWPRFEVKMNSIIKMSEDPQKNPFKLEPAIEEILSILRSLAKRDRGVWLIDEAHDPNARRKWVASSLDPDHYYSLFLSKEEFSKQRQELAEKFARLLMQAPSRDNEKEEKESKDKEKEE